MLKHRFIVVSKDDTFKLGREAAAKVTETEPTVVFDYVGDNKEPLAAVYNRVLDADKESDFVYFMHADVSFDVLALAAHVESVAGKYDVIGLCGCAKFSVGQSPLNWYCGSNPFPDARWGCVSHGELGGQTSFFSQHSPEVRDHEVACIDGLCIVFTRKAVDSGLRFDPAVGDFDFYDSDISMQAVLKYGLRLGVVVRKDLVHYSIGKSILSREFLEREARFRTKWGFDPPKGSEVEKIMAAGRASGV